MDIFEKAKKAYDEADDAMMATPEYKAKEKAWDAVVATPEWKDYVYRIYNVY